MADLVGFTALLLVVFMTMILSLYYPNISKILFSALLIRILFILIGHYIVPLPDSTADAVGQENEAWAIAQNGFFKLFDYYKGPDPRFHSWLIAIPYSIFGRSLLMAQSISLFLGIGCVFLGWKLAMKLWDYKTAKKIAWIIALFPSLILYSVLVLREVYICFFLLIALIGVVNWVKDNKLSSIVLAMTGFTGAVFFHGAMAVGAMTFALVIGLVSLNRLFKSLLKYKLNTKILIIFLSFLSLLILYISNKINIPYLNNFDFVSDMSVLTEKTKISTRGTASYPQWTIANSPLELIYKTPVRSFLFLFSPLPWEIKEIRHLIGFFDASLYIYLFYLIIRNIKTIWKDPALKIILLILISYIFVFGIGVGNFGTAIRHRSKFTIIFILLAAPLIKKIIISKKLPNY